MNIPDTLKYTKGHEWVEVDGDIVTIGITNHAQEQLGDVVYIELPDEEDEIVRDETFGVVESTKAVSDLYAPVSGRVVKVNEELVDEPEVVNQSPYGEGWMIKVELSETGDLDELLSPEQYAKLVEDAD